VAVSGYGYLSPELTVKVGLTSITGWHLASTDATVGENGWEATLTVPASVSGAATLRAAVVVEGGQVIASDTVAVTLSVQEPPEEPYLVLDRPAGASMAVAGHWLFFDGRLERSGGGPLRLAVWEACETEVANFRFNLRSSTYWYGRVLVPEDVSGPACAVATVGEPGEEGWVAAQVPIAILAEDSEGSVGVMIANPSSGRTVRGGGTLAVNGVAYNAPGGGVQVQVTLANGRIVANTTVQADAYGYWETTVNLPADLDGEAVVAATVGTGATSLASTQVLIDVVPGDG